MVDAPAEAGSQVQIVARSGKTWTATVAEPRGAATGGGHLVSLAGSEWQSDPDVDDSGRHPNDPAWLDDAADDLDPEAARRDAP